MMQRQRCSNDNHGRGIVRVRHCSSCGVLLNPSVRPSQCPSERHARMRRLLSPYCMDCGARLTSDR